MPPASASMPNLSPGRSPLSRGVLLRALIIACLVPGLSACGDPKPDPAAEARAAAARALTWQTFVAPDGLFQVSVPAAMVSSQQQVDAQTVMQSHTAEVKDAAFLAAVMPLPPGFDASSALAVQVLFDKAQSNALTNMSATLREQQDLTLHGGPARAFSATSADGSARVRMLLVHGQLIQLMAITKDEAAYGAAMDQYLQSLVIQAPR